MEKVLENPFCQCFPASAEIRIKIKRFFVPLSGRLWIWPKLKTSARVTGEQLIPNLMRFSLPQPKSAA